MGITSIRYNKQSCRAINCLNWTLLWNKWLSAHLWRLRKTCLKYSRWIRISLDFELSKVVLIIKSRKTRWGHYVWVNKEDLYNCIALSFIYSVHTNVCQLGGTTITLQEGVFGWIKWLCAVNLYCIKGTLGLFVLVSGNMCYIKLYNQLSSPR